MRKLSIALYTHSTNPRGGVVHTLELGDALTRAGHEVTIHAPDPTGAGFFRSTAAAQVSIHARADAKTLTALVSCRIAEISAHIRSTAQKFDVHHSQDSITANALADCVSSGHIRNFVRTVHHLDHFTDPQLDAWQTRGIQAAQKVFCVSRVWQSFLQQAHHLTADLVPNGVSLSRFSPAPTARDAELRKFLGLTGGPVCLAIGGIEARKNTINILRAFRLFARDVPDAKLVIAGGASLLDHSAYQASFAAELAGGAGKNVICTGPLADADMPSLYRLADVLVFPSLKEGFGLVVLESLASETPVVASRIPPFTEYLTDQNCNFADPADPVSIAAAIAQALSPPARAAARLARITLAARMSWEASAAHHLALYSQLLRRVPEHA
jgi:glycosyltransferase-like protein